MKLLTLSSRCWPPSLSALAEAAPAELPAPTSVQEELAVQPTAATDVLAVSFVEDLGRTTGPTMDEQPTAEQPVPVVSSGFA